MPDGNDLVDDGWDDAVPLEEVGAGGGRLRDVFAMVSIEVVYHYGGRL